MHFLKQRAPRKHLASKLAPAGCWRRRVPCRKVLPARGSPPVTAEEAVARQAAFEGKATFLLLVNAVSN